jgi:phosphoribosylglycinamide formyltransferase-1
MTPPLTGTAATKLSVVVLISGQGSNLQALIDQAADLGYVITGVISNRPDAQGLVRAQQASIRRAVIDHRTYVSRESFEADLAKAVDNFSPDLIVLAGFMRVLTAGFVQRYEGKMINIHPSLLPAHRGLHTHRQALAAGDKWHGCSVHYVTAELDGGPVIIQSRLPINPDDTEETLQKRIQYLEHRIYPLCLGWIAAGRLSWCQGVPRMDNQALTKPVMIEPKVGD